MPHNWDDNARIRADQIEAGLDLTFSKVFVPFFKDYLAARHAGRVLEVGGGTGHLARELVAQAGRYVLIEPSAGMYSVAIETLKGTPVEFHRQTIEDFSRSRQEFDVALSHVCVQVVSNIDVFLKSIASTLRHGGEYILTMPHPAFYNNYKRFFPPDQFLYMNEMATTVDFNVTLDPDRKIVGVPYHHRPISRYVEGLRRAGLAVTLLDEIYPTADIQRLYGSPWINPRYLAIGGIRLDEAPSLGVN
jgi:SAM-dependent methyltransferase